MYDVCLLCTCGACTGPVGSSQVRATSWQRRVGALRWSVRVPQSLLGLHTALISRTALSCTALSRTALSRAVLSRAISA